MDEIIRESINQAVERLLRDGRESDIAPMLRWGSRLERDETTGCWLWQGAADSAGYGQVGYRGKTTKIHRWFYERLVGPIPTGLTLDHLCRSRNCVNPAHLEPVTLAMNVSRSWKTADAPRRNPNAEKTHCPRGHEYTVRGDGKRRCKVCDRERKVERRKTDPAFLEAERNRRRRYYAKTVGGVPVPMAERTHCPKGHEYTAENTYVSKKGHRQCRACKRAAHQAWAQRQRAG